jgi:hypothetical protein
MKTWLISAALAVAGAAAHGAQSCDDLRAQIESKIAAAGVTRFTVTVVDANAAAAGQVVGSCELGSRKVVYEKGAGEPRPAPAAPASSSREPMLTECKDGTVSVGGDCRKP